MRIKDVIKKLKEIEGVGTVSTTLQEFDYVSHDGIAPRTKYTARSVFVFMGQEHKKCYMGSGDTWEQAHDNLLIDLEGVVKG